MMKRMAGFAQAMALAVVGVVLFGTGGAGGQGLRRPMSM